MRFNFGQFWTMYIEFKATLHEFFSRILIFVILKPVSSRGRGLAPGNPGLGEVDPGRGQPRPGSGSKKPAGVRPRPGPGSKILLGV